MNYPIHAEFYSALESILLTQAKKLVEDVAKHQNTDSKELWQRIKSQIKVGLLDAEVDDQELYCPHPFVTDSGAVKTRCRAPCLVGFSACPRHVNQPLLKDKQTTYESVDRIVDYQGSTYFIDKHRIARDKNGMPRGQMDEDDVLVLFEKSDKPQGWEAP